MIFIHPNNHPNTHALIHWSTWVGLGDRFFKLYTRPKKGQKDKPLLEIDLSPFLLIPRSGVLWKAWNKYIYDGST